MIHLTYHMPFVPQQFHRFFWDTNPSALGDQHKNQVIGRLLEYGDEEAILWIRKKFSDQDIIACIKKNRSLTQKAANFWAFIFDIPKNEVLCLQESFRNQHRKLWNY